MTSPVPADQDAPDDEAVISLEDLHAATTNDAPDAVRVEPAPADPADDPDIPTYELPEREPLDAFSAATLAVNEELARQLAAHSDHSVVVVPGPIVDAALGAAEGWPRIPAWTGDARRVGGITRPDATGPEPEIALSVRPDGTLDLEVTVTVDGRDVTASAGVEPWQAEAWFMAGLGAVAAGRSAQAGDDTTGETPAT